MVKLGQLSISEKAKRQLHTLKQSYGAARTYPVPKGIVPLDDGETYRGDLLTSWINSMKSTELHEVIELENLALFLKQTESQRIWQKIHNNQELTKTDLEYVRLISDIIINLHKLKHGERRVNINTDLKDFREMVFNADTGDNGREFSDREPEGSGTNPAEVQSVPPVRTSS
mgnify:CR=1 FL=1